MIYNLNKKKLISRRTVFADSMAKRLRGMILRSFDDFDAMVFVNCNAVHTFFMSIPIDIIFLDRHNKVMKCADSVPPWKPVISSKISYVTIELPAGTIQHTGTEPGDTLDLNAELEENELKKHIPKDIIPAETVIPFSGENKQ